MPGDVDMARVRSGLRRLRARTRGELSDEAGLTLIEMVIALTMLAVTLLVLAYGLYGSMSALQAARQRTTFLELANAEVEQMRALDYDTIGVDPSDPVLLSGTHYDAAGKFEGRTAVTTKPAGAALTATTPAMRTVVDSTPTAGVSAGIEGLNRGYTVERWVTWTNAEGGAAAPTDIDKFKRLDVRISWERRGGAPGFVEYSSVYYPGDLGKPPPPPAPTASFTVTPASGAAVVNTSFSFTGSATTGGAGLTIIKWEWDFGNGQTSLVQSPSSVTYNAIGAYTVTLKVTNSAGGVSAPATQQILVGAPAITNTMDPNWPNSPTASFTITAPVGAQGPAPLEVFVDASDSSDPDSDPLLYFWDWGDGTTGTGVAPVHIYNVPRSTPYTITLTVKDPSGQPSPSPDSDQVTVNGVVCEVLTASFKNPPANSASNAITVKSSGPSAGRSTPVDSNFAFTATTSGGCNSVIFSLPTQTAGTPYQKLLTAYSEAGGIRTFTDPGISTDKYHTGNQVYEVIGRADGVVVHTLRPGFRVT